ncbi:MAG: response regulator [Lachnospiraceae bacterium]|jgi:two-component system response regulator YesN|nr:response regulator [Lachnospiraceae bacterium]
MIKIFIIDDEIPIRQWIRFCIERSGSCFQVAGEASNGEAGLKALENMDIDIVILDIMMPGLNGLEVLPKLSQIHPGLGIIMLTNFAEFEYIQKAVRNGAREYFLKSEITEESLMACLNKIAASQKQNSLLLNLSSEAESQTVRLLCEQILRHTITSQKQFLETANKYPRPLSYTKNLFVVGIRCLSEDIVHLDPIPLSDISEHLTAMHSVVYNKTDLFLVCEMNKLTSQLMIFHSIAGMLRWLCSHISYAYLGISNIYQSFSDLYHGLSEALISLNSGFYKKPASITYIYETKDETLDPNILNSCSRDILNIAKTCPFEELEKGLYQLFDYFRSSRPSDIQSVKDYFLELVYLIHSVTMSNSLQFQFLDKSVHTEFRKRLSESIYLDDVQKAVLELIGRFYVPQNPVKFSMPVTDAISYIKGHYCENITLKETADAIHMNADYLGRLFKKETGISFNAYVTNMKMEYASYLISNTNLKKYEIAEKLGFTNFSYFSRLYSAYKSR